MGAIFSGSVNLHDKDCDLVIARRIANAVLSRILSTRSI